MKTTEETSALRRQCCRKDERDVRMETESRSHASDALVAAAEVFCVVCAVRGDPAWRGFLSVALAGAAAMLMHRYGYDREKPWLYMGLALGAAALGMGAWFLLG